MLPSLGLTDYQKMLEMDGVCVGSWCDRRIYGRVLGESETSENSENEDQSDSSVAQSISLFAGDASGDKGNTTYGFAFHRVSYGLTSCSQSVRRVVPVISSPLFQPPKSQTASICARWRLYMFATRHLSAEARRRVSRLLKPFACLAASLTASLVLSLPASAALTFTATQIASGDTYSGSMVSGDFNNDGIVDLVTFNAYTISFYKGLGGGQYAAPADSPFGGGLQSFAADFNLDGKLDLAVADGYNGVSIYLGNGDGTFRQGTTIMNSAATTDSIAVADFNGDHVPDIALNTCPHSRSE